MHQGGGKDIDPKAIKAVGPELSPAKVLRRHPIVRVCRFNLRWHPDD